MATKPHLVMILEVAVRDRNVGGVFRPVHQAICSLRQEAMVDPNIGGAFDVNGIAIAGATECSKIGRGEDMMRARGENVMDINSMDNDVGDPLDGNLGGAHEVDFCTTTVYGLVARHNEFALKLDSHVLSEDDPERLCSGDSVAESAGGRVAGAVIVAGNDVDISVLAPEGILAETDCARSERLTPVLPVRVATPAVVDVVPSVA